MLLWAASAAMGGVAVLLTSLVGVVAVLVGLPFLFSRDRWVAASGFLVGFGVLWTGLITRQLTAGAERDGIVPFWLTIGLVPIAVGALLTSAVAIHQVRLAHRALPQR